MVLNLNSDTELIDDSYSDILNKLVNVSKNTLHIYLNVFKNTFYIYLY